MKLNKSVLVLATSTVMAAAEAQTPITFDFVFQGERTPSQLVGAVTFDKDLLSNVAGGFPSTYFYPSSELLSFNMTLSDAGIYDGSYSASDYNQLYVIWKSGTTLDLTQELVGQPTATGNWGYYNINNEGAFSFEAFPFSAGTPSFWSNGNYSVYSADGIDSFRLVSMTPRPVTPVPEPETWMMMGAGLGLIGWLARRRRTRVFDFT